MYTWTFSKLLELNPAPLSLFLCLSHRQLYNHKHTLEKHTLIVLKWGPLWKGTETSCRKSANNKTTLQSTLFIYLFIVIPIICWHSLQALWHKWFNSVSCIAKFRLTWIGWAGLFCPALRWKDWMKKKKTYLQLKRRSLCRDPIEGPFVCWLELQ